jgi:hypothetical protein
VVLERFIGAGFCPSLDRVQSDNGKRTVERCHLLLPGRRRFLQRLVMDSAAKQQWSHSTGTPSVMNIQDSTISGNTDAGIYLYSYTAPPTVTVQRTTISGNARRGMLLIGPMQLTIENSTIAGNTAPDTTGNLNGGGGIMGIPTLRSQSVAVRLSTIAGNSAGTVGGNIQLTGNTVLTLDNSIVANGTAPTNPDIAAASSATVTSNFSLIRTGSP